MIGMSQANAIVPAARSVYIAASGPYATDDIASEEKTGSAFHFGRRSVISASDASACPNRARRTTNVACPRRVRGSIAAGRATTTPGCLLYTSDAADEEDSVDLGG